MSVVASVVYVLCAGAIPAWAAPGTYASWTAGGLPGARTGAADLTAVGFPTAQVASDAGTFTTPSGASAYLGPSTPPGTAYGSSQGQGYLNVGTAAANSPSTTTLTFTAPTPTTGWAFILGDVDADQVTITATDPTSATVPAAELGFAGVFNYCAATPRPGSCTGGGPFTDVPTWDPTTATLTGNGPDTPGAAGWFQPTTALATLTFTLTALNGTPIFQLWLVALPQPTTSPIPSQPAGPPAASPAAALLPRTGLPTWPLPVAALLLVAGLLLAAAGRPRRQRHRRP